MNIEEKKERYNDIILLRSKGVTLQDIADKYSVSRQRIDQILKKGKPRISKSKLKLNQFLYNLEGRDLNREKVRIRDNHQCQDCKRKWIQGERRFDVHHLNGLCGKKSKGYDKEKDMKGLVTLCHRCHYNRPEHATKKKSLTKV